MFPPLRSAKPLPTAAARVPVTMGGLQKCKTGCSGLWKCSKVLWRVMMWLGHILRAAWRTAWFVRHNNTFVCLVLPALCGVLLTAAALGNRLKFYNNTNVVVAYFVNNTRATCWCVAILQLLPAIGVEIDYVSANCTDGQFTCNATCCVRERHWRP